MTDDQLVEIFTDGACKGNPGPGVWGVLMRYQGLEKKFHGGEALTTNNRMELLAAIEGLCALKRPCNVSLTTDSSYVKNGVEQWMPQWVKNNWRTASKKPVKNVDLWQRLYEQIEIHDVKLSWVKGHSGHRENEIADQLANDGAAQFIE